MVKKFLYGLLAALLLYLLWNYKWIPYAYNQASGQLQIVFGAVPAEEFIASPSVPDSVKENIRLVQEVKQFTLDSLGLSPSGSYEKIYDQQGQPLMWLVTACPAFEFKAYQWDYPIVGRMSYRGFFIREDAIKEEERLKKEGLDTRIRTVSAWSTLGFLNDPILSDMLYRSKGSIVNTTIHELTHSTIFIWGETSLNENLASFIGDEGAKWFLKDRFGENSEIYQNYIRRDTDSEQFSQYMLQSAKSLDSLYQSFEGKELSTEEMLAKKSALIATIAEGLKSLEFENQRYYTLFDNELPNNAFFMAFVRYRERQNEFREEYNRLFPGDLRGYIQYLKEKY